MGKSGKKYGEGFGPVVDRIKEATGTRTQVELAAVLGIRQSSISDAKRRDSVPADWYLTLFREFGLNPDWLAYGRGPRYIKTKEGYQPFDQPALSETVREEASPYGDPMASAKVVSYYAMAGGTSESGQWKPVPAGKLTIPKGFDRKSLLVVKMDGGGMEPMIRRGAYVGLDRDQTTVLSGEIYGVLLPFEGLVVRRVFLEADKTRFVLRAENEGHADQHFTFDEYKDRILGRMVWMMQEV
ncbi:LexA family transcriptional regulator [Desulfovibrio ferrophilus]|uniref:Putative bacteriophage CI repressor helix-turn-helix domain protein n=1 Tax=Desulfovibrio ferrophilus TaxID=241368 RepID=A0A2Z6B055_9BACT|nr:helix-turn-helix domain-containing protein [Desulfovibrio ferrophilus]BBD08881.1 putative bacteriophage CI repressor helix-turn-helix domain protein [Desulfovibrio ferrophilus]